MSSIISAPRHTVPYMNYLEPHCTKDYAALNRECSAMAFLIWNGSSTRAPWVKLFSVAPPHSFPIHAEGSLWHGSDVGWAWSRLYYRQLSLFLILAAKIQCSLDILPINASLSHLQISLLFPLFGLYRFWFTSCVVYILHHRFWMRKQRVQ